ncbi:MAG: MBL fold metallo-hydrolase [Campylobacteraceae bacterium]|nr:MBL fold metallo-hydrolase [Campylobacteraceae bacterium]
MKKFHAKCFLISLSDEYMLFDSGYPADFNAIMHSWPQLLYKYLLPVNIEPQDVCLNQLEKENIKSEEIRYIFISHFHADHIGALRDFPKARFVCSGQEYKRLKKFSVFKQVSKGFVSKFLPDDFENRVIYIEDLQIVQDKIFPVCYALPFAEDIFAVALPGHTDGQFGLWLPRENTLLAADSAWTKENYTDNSLPHWIGLHFCENAKSFRETLELLKNLKNIKIILSHGDE